MLALRESSNAILSTGLGGVLLTVPWKPCGKEIGTTGTVVNQDSVVSCGFSIPLLLLSKKLIN